MAYKMTDEQPTKPGFYWACFGGVGFYWVCFGSVGFRKWSQRIEEPEE
jgi:hypothetical protein